MYAVEHWHYSKRSPAGGRHACVGAWEDGRFVGAAMFTRGGNCHLASSLGLDMTQACELVRVAMCDHECNVSQFLAHAVRMLKKKSPGLRAIVSYADPSEGHVGGIYQASNWLYLGTTKPNRELRSDGLRLQKRAYTGKQFGGKAAGGSQRTAMPANATWVVVPPKYKYAYPLDKEMRKQLQSIAKPYPKSAASEVVSPEAPPPESVQPDYAAPIDNATQAMQDDSSRH